MRRFAPARGIPACGRPRSTWWCGAATPSSLKIANRVLDRIGSSRPLRAMIVMPATGTPRARVSSDSGSDHRHGVFNELVELRGNRVALPSSVTSLLVADLPVFLWWQGELPPEGDDGAGRDYRDDDADDRRLRSGRHRRGCPRRCDGDRAGRPGLGAHGSLAGGDRSPVRRTQPAAGCSTIWSPSR